MTPIFRGQDAAPAILVSRCLLGDPVRYDGADRRSDELIATLAGRFRLIPVCPEVGAGLGVPRPPVRLQYVGGELRACGVADPGLDVTGALVRYAREMVAGLPEIAGCVLKARSPSCAAHDCPIHDPSGMEIDRGPGLFVRELQRVRPELPLIDEGGIADPSPCAAFLAALRGHPSVVR